MTFNVNGTIHIDIPALAAFVAYLEGVQQKQIDTLVTQVKTLTASQKNSTTGLQASVESQQK